MTGFLASLAVALILALPLRAAPAAQTVHVTLDPGSGAVQVQARFASPDAAVRVPDAAWMRVDSLTLGGAPAELPEDGILDPAAHAGRDIRIEMSGEVPRPGNPLGLVSVSEEGGYLVGADWLPVLRQPRIDIEITVDVPDPLRVVVTGTPLADETADGRFAGSFRFEGRADDLGVFVGPYVIGETERNGLRLRTYFETADNDLSEAYMQAAGAFIDRYDAQIGAYPYDAFSVVSAPIPVGLGFASLTYVSQSILAHPYMRGRSLAHEVLHSWWGNAVGVEYSSGNWAEGLTTFQADYALAEDAGADAARTMRRDWLRALASLDAEENRALTQFVSSSHDGRQAVGYGKAALVFHMLRDEIGHAAFDAGIRQFYAQNLSKIAAWRDLQGAFEAAAGRELDWFFEQWVTRAGLPRVTLDDVGMKGDAVLVTLRQDAPVYRLTVPVVVQTADGAETFDVVMTAETVTTELTVAAAPVAVQIDPRFDVARTLLEGEVAPTLQDVTRAKDLALLRVGPEEPATAAAIDLLKDALRQPDLEPVSRDVAADARRVVVLGTTKEVEAFIDAEPALQPQAISAKGTARAWTQRAEDGRIFLFLSAGELTDLAAHLPVLKYYGNRSFVRFDGEDTETGKWEVTDSPLVHRF